MHLHISKGASKYYCVFYVPLKSKISLKNKWIKINISQLMRISMYGQSLPTKPCMQASGTKFTHFCLCAKSFTSYNIESTNLNYNSIHGWDSFNYKISEMVRQNKAHFFSPPTQMIPKELRWFSCKCGLARSCYSWYALLDINQSVNCLKIKYNKEKNFEEKNKYV